MIGVETLRIAWGGITANKLRSGLTILGMTIGVASVIVLIAVGNGSSKAVQASINSLGTNVLRRACTGGLRGGARARAARRTSRSPSRTPKRSRTRAQAPDVKSASPVVNASGVKLVSRRLELRTVLVRRHDALLPDGPQLPRRRKAPRSPPTT